MKKINLPPEKFISEITANDPNQEIFSTKRYYSFPVKKFYLKRFETVLELLTKSSYENILDVGFGSGIFLPTLKQRTPNLAGVDSHSHIDAVKELMAKIGTNAELKKGSILNLPFEDNHFECVICLSVLEFVEDTDRAIREIARISKPNATIIIGAPVANKITDFCYALLGKKDQNKIHKANHQKIINSVKKFLEVKKIIKFPSFTPLNYSMFFVLSAKKR